MTDATLLIDGYKADHRSQYPKGTELVFSNLTARSSRVPSVDRTVFFGLRYFVVRYLMQHFNETFFDIPREWAVEDYQAVMDNYLGKGAVTAEHIGELHDLGYLPLEIWALPEGSIVPLRVPMLVMWNTDPRFFWLTNYMETLLSATLWGPITSATTALRYRDILEEACDLTGGDRSFVPFQAHDFSFRGMFGVEAAEMSGAAHLLFFKGTDTIPAIQFVKRYYGLHDNNTLVGASVPATEHSVMCMGGEEDELGTFKRLLTEVYPKGIVSVVSDTWDFWKVVTETLPALKDIIMARDGKLVIRPDSGDPVHILCGYSGKFGDEYVNPDTPEGKGLIQCLWDIFGGTSKWVENGPFRGVFRQLDPHIGAIYGDSITPERCEEICRRLAVKGFASTNVVFGVGSYTYQYVTRDTFGMAVKATFGRVNGEDRSLFKKPKTDGGSKNSAKGLLAVYEKDGTFELKENATWEEVKNCAFVPVFSNGANLLVERFETLRARVDGYINKQF